MIHLAISTFFVWLFFRIKEKDSYIDGFTSAALVLAPALLIFIINMGKLIIEYPPWASYGLEAFYFIVPFFILNALGEFSKARCIAYSGIVVGIHFSTAFVYLSAMNALVA